MSTSCSMYIPFCDKHTQANISLQSSLPLAPDLPDRLGLYANLYRLITRNEMLASCFILDSALQSCRVFDKTHRLVPLTEPCPPGAATSLCKKESVTLLKERHGKFFLLLASVWPVRVSVSRSCPYLCDHGKSQDEEGDAADQGEERLVFPQVLGELVRHGGDDGLDGGKLELR